MTREEFTGVTFSDLDSSGTQISRLSEFFVDNSAEIAIGPIYTAQSAYFMNWQAEHKIIVYGTEPRRVDINPQRYESAFGKPTSIICERYALLTRMSGSECVVLFIVQW